MKAITLYQPWANLVAIGVKRIETRSWGTKYCGPLAIHAGMNKKFISFKSPDYVCGQEPFYSIMTQNAENIIQSFKSPLDQAKRILPLGAVIATCDLIGVDQFGPWLNERLDGGKSVIWAKGRYYFELTEQERAFGDFTVGRYGWFLANVKLLPKPVPARGALGLWEWEFDVEAGR